MGIVPGPVLKERRRSTLKTAGGCTAAWHTGKRSRAETFGAGRRRETVMFALVSSCLMEMEFAPLIKKMNSHPKVCCAVHCLPKSCVQRIGKIW